MWHIYGHASNITLLSLSHLLVKSSNWQQHHAISPLKEADKMTYFLSKLSYQYNRFTFNRGDSSHYTSNIELTSVRNNIWGQYNKNGDQVPQQFIEDKKIRIAMQSWIPNHSTIKKISYCQILKKKFAVLLELFWCLLIFDKSCNICIMAPENTFVSHLS